MSEDRRKLKAFVGSIGGHVPTAAAMLGIKNKSSLYAYLVDAASIPGPVMRCVELYEQLPARRQAAYIKEHSPRS